MVERIWRRFDWSLFFIMLILIGVGCIMVYSSYEMAMPTRGKPLMENLVFRQGLFASIGMVIYFAVALVDYHVLQSLDRWIYLFIIVILGLTQIVGDTLGGAQRWLSFSFFDVQTSELSKVLLITVLAKYLAGDERNLESAGPFLLSALVLAPPLLLIYKQPDLGTTLLLLATWLGMVYLAGVRWRHLVILVIGGLVAAPIIWFQLEDYMRDRVIMFFLPDHDPSGASYNVTQALISIGSGGMWGKGLFQGTQSQLYFLRVRHTDFIFSVLAEELGFVGALLLLLLFAFLILHILHIAVNAQDDYGRLIAGGVACMLLVQTTVNLGMNANLLPVTGLTLPLVSYGGSSLLTILLALGLTQSVAVHSTDTKPATLQEKVRT
ncbi:MAG: rod shape-determining protein RodA [Anaerolineales bacterium]